MYKRVILDCIVVGKPHCVCTTRTCYYRTLVEDGIFGKVRLISDVTPMFEEGANLIVKGMMGEKGDCSVEECVDLSNPQLSEEAVGYEEFLFAVNRKVAAKEVDSK